jgi:hypothetical protein
MSFIFSPLLVPSVEQQVSEDAINDIPDNSDEIQDLERELQRLKTERRKVELRRKIEEEKEDSKKLQHPIIWNVIYGVF